MLGSRRGPEFGLLKHRYRDSARGRRGEREVGFSDCSKGPLTRARGSLTRRDAFAHENPFGNRAVALPNK